MAPSLVTTIVFLLLFCFLILLVGILSYVKHTNTCQAESHISNVSIRTFGYAAHLLDFRRAPLYATSYFG